MAMSDVDAFMTWFTNSPCDSRLPDPGVSRLVLSSSPGAGRCLRAVVPVPAHDFLLAVPTDDYRLILTPHRCAAFLSLCGCFPSPQAFATPLEAFDALVLFFCHLRSKPACRLSSIWWPYTNLLPVEHFDSVSVFAGNLRDEDCLVDLLHTLHCTDVSSAVEGLVERFKLSSRRLEGVLCHLKANRADHAWAWSTVNSRCVYTRLDPFPNLHRIKAKCAQLLNSTKAGDEVRSFDPDLSTGFVLRKHKSTEHQTPHLAVIPLFDFANHNPKSIITLTEPHPIKGLRLQAGMHDIAAGEEITINYGCHDNLILYCNYGFTLAPELAVDHDVVHPSLGELEAACRPAHATRFAADVAAKLAVLGVRSSDLPTPTTRWPTVYLSTAAGASFHLECLLARVCRPPDDLLLPGSRQPDAACRRRLVGLLLSAVDKDLETVRSSRLHRSLTALDALLTGRRLLLTRLSASELGAGET